MGRLVLKDNEYGGCLITFCGLDGSGKTSLIQMLSNYLEQHGKKTTLTKQPTNAVRNSEIFRNFMDFENHDGFEYRALSLLAASDRIQHTNQVIVPMLKNGECVISDRYFYSCLANLRARGYTEDKWIYEIGKSIVTPTLSVFVDVPVEIAVQRVRSRPEEKDRYIDMDLQYKLRDEYLRIAKDVGGIVVSSEKSKEECLEEIVNVLSERGRKDEWGNYAKSDIRFAV